MQTPEEIRTGFVALAGRPNAGKSTLMNALIRNKVSITSRVPQTTRHLIRGIFDAPDAQIVFVDAPGIHSFKKPLAQYLNAIAKKGLKDIDIVLYVADVSRQPAAEEEKVIKNILSAKTNVIMALNKIDKHVNFINDYIELWHSAEAKMRSRGSKLLYYIPVSAKTGRNLEELIGAIKENLAFGHPFYEKGTVTDFPLKLRAADIIREKLFLKLKEEIPHSVAVEIKEIEDKEKIVYIKADIYVNRVSQKRIVIGDNAQLIRDVGIASRKELEDIFNKKVYLDTHVKVIYDWQKKTRILKELGYDDASL